MKKYVVSEETSLKNFTDNTCAQASMCLRTLLKTREVRVNGEKISSDVRLKRGDEVAYYMTKAQESKQAFTTVYEDAHVVVVDKESGVNSEAVFCALSERGETYFIHRLDRNTQGLLIFAKSKAAEGELLAAFRERRVEKVYHAVVLGRMPKAHAVETAYLKKDEKNARVTVSDAPARGEKIITEYEILEERGETSLVKITLHTGKTHQIRAHLAHLHHPVVGDEKYGDGDYNRRAHLTRQLLLAKELRVEGSGILAYLKEKTFISQKNL